jgi:hypothetical protein
MKLTRRGERVVTFLVVVGALALIWLVAIIPPGWWL